MRTHVHVKPESGGPPQAVVTGIVSAIAVTLAAVGILFSAIAGLAVLSAALAFAAWYVSRASRATARTGHYESVIDLLCAALDLRDSVSMGHSRRVALLAIAVGRELGLSNDEIRGLEKAAILHDIGKIGLDQRILSKPGALSEAEWAEMRRHPEVGYRALEGTFLGGCIFSGRVAGRAAAEGAA